MWNGDYAFLLTNLIQKDFKVRYRNMSLGVLWSLLNPLVTMAALTFVFTKIFPSHRPQFPVFVLCGLVPFNFFTLAWSTGTSSLIDNAPLMKRVPIPREIVPIAAVLGNCAHLSIQIGLLLAFTLAFGNGINWHWLWLPVVWGFEIVFVCGLALITSAHQRLRPGHPLRGGVHQHDPLLAGAHILFLRRHSSSATMLIYRFNPVAALVLALRNILLDSASPRMPLLLQLAASSVLMLILGLFVFRTLKAKFYDYL